jgi:serine/threonine-protein phosphatase 6 catalytic subunit
VQVKEILIEESNVVEVQGPAIVCGDIHGQFYDLLELLKTGGPLPDKQYVFMGDYVDRGLHSLETFVYLLLLKISHPDRVTLLRGNHESRQITQVYGFYDECQKKFGFGAVWSLCVEVFDFFPLAAVVNGKMLCVHGGLSPRIKTVDQIRLIDRKMEIPHVGPFCDLVWSDPELILSWQANMRGAGWLFGSEVVTAFNYLNGLELICRSHQLVQEGFKYYFEDKGLVTVWSAPNYCYRCGNLASILDVDERGERTFRVFREVEKEHHEASAQRPSYFL